MHVNYDFYRKNFHRIYFHRKSKHRIYFHRKVLNRKKVHRKNFIEKVNYQDLKSII